MFTYEIAPVFILMENGILLSCNAMSAEYLFMTDKIYDPRFDTGDKRLMDRLMELSEYMVRRIREQPDRFYLIMEPELVNVSFWYLPRQLRGVCQVEG
ncbi:hypothetical protein MSG28_014932 [Choristoneura fumiferana]|uniref:Uncharacterized protein n=1 Tax=Choristoneura fumiferana TaxID=7141 RepID=A0ACC0KY91_CHOFU|nr:hypothetical protein MSG28_014932 [Choristoneura fumiferana]